MINSFHEDLKYAGADYGLRIFEAGKVMDIPRILSHADERYGPRNKISFLVCGRHGFGNEMQLGNGPVGFLNMEKLLARKNPKFSK